eukprot:TRINITY_DN1225_c0_g3_i1.p1 TRINITY_DN1225_c0_g3~~TRINITY_DN1225_c0_g3_i1.p1  ORF type:complete len:407 (+),score=70.61 TRINITY_DN1225_c0_g3_i1:57-1223(+)
MAMNDLCSAFAQLTATSEGGTMMENLTDGRDLLQQPATGGRIAGVAGPRRGNMRYPPPVPGVQSYVSRPYERRENESTDTRSLRQAINKISALYTPVPEECSCLPPTRENIYAGIMHSAKERRRWDESPLEQVRHSVAEMARLGTEDNEYCVPWRVTPRNTRHLPISTNEGDQYDADFLFVAPSPQKYYEGETIVFTPKLSVQPNACMLSVLITLECKFKACWEMAHLVSLKGADYRERLPYAAKIICGLAAARATPDETPWALLRPFARPINAIAPPVDPNICNPDGFTNIQASDVSLALEGVLRTNANTEDSAFDMENFTNPQQQNSKMQLPLQPQPPVPSIVPQVQPQQPMMFDGQPQPMMQQQQQQQQNNFQNPNIPAMSPLEA